jgi:hypothetical protein
MRSWLVGLILFVGVGLAPLWAAGGVNAQSGLSEWLAASARGVRTIDGCDTHVAAVTVKHLGRVPLVACAAGEAHQLVWLSVEREYVGRGIPGELEAEVVVCEDGEPMKRIFGEVERYFARDLRLRLVECEWLSGGSIPPVLAVSRELEAERLAVGVGQFARSLAPAECVMRPLGPRVALDERVLRPGTRLIVEASRMEPCSWVALCDAPTRLDGKGCRVTLLGVWNVQSEREIEKRLQSHRFRSRRENAGR